MPTKRLTRNLVSLCLALGVSIAIALAGDQHGMMARVSIGTAYAALLFFGIALSIGPLNVLSHQRTPVSTYFRRDIGIWAGCLSLVHVIAGLQVHMGGNMVSYFLVRLPGSGFPVPRHDLFGLANYIGLVSLFVTILLVSISNNAALRFFGPIRWKFLQRHAYLAAITVVVHGFMYQYLERRIWPLTLLAISVTVIVLALRTMAWYRRG